MKNIKKTTYFRLYWTRLTLLAVLTATPLIWGQVNQTQAPNPATSTGPANPATGTGTPNPAMNGNNPITRTPGATTNAQTNRVSHTPLRNTVRTNAVLQKRTTNGTTITPTPTPQTAPSPAPSTPTQSTPTKVQ
jgi:hypothetical protein